MLNKKGTWPQALVTFLGPILGVLIFRWLLLEPFVIPSGSMIPTLLVHDHILVNKLSYGVHLPFSEKWLLQWATPKKREIAVFKFPKNPDVFYVKRVVAVAGDEIAVEHGQLLINGEVVPQESSPEKYSGEQDETDFDHFFELGNTVRYRAGNKENSFYEKTKVPAGYFFVIGDNRDQSSDSRFWGFVPEANAVGRAWVIWLSCDKTLQTAPFLCDPQSMRWARMFLRAQ
jgi:signal peptidase I